MSRTRYKPFGEVLLTSNQETSGTLNTEHKFTGQIFDTSTDLYFYNARYYDRVTRRFTQADTVVQSIASPQDLNRYSYVRNNPLGSTDPTGHRGFVPKLTDPNNPGPDLPKPAPAAPSNEGPLIPSAPSPGPVTETSSPPHGWTAAAWALWTGQVKPGSASGPSGNSASQAQQQTPAQQTGTPAVGPPPAPTPPQPVAMPTPSPQASFWHGAAEFGLGVHSAAEASIVTGFGVGFGGLMIGSAAIPGVGWVATIPLTIAGAATIASGATAGGLIVYYEAWPELSSGAEEMWHSIFH